MFSFDTQKYGKLTVNFQYDADYWENHKTTTAMIYDKDGNLVEFGAAYCVPTDRFEKAVGRKLALQRALQCLLLPKEERKEAWKAYFSKLKKNNRPKVAEVSA